MSRRGSHIRWWIVLVPFLLTACQPDLDTQPPTVPKDTVRVGNLFGLKALHPFTSLQGTASDVIPMVFDGLVDGYAGPLALAKKIDSTD